MASATLIGIGGVSRSGKTTLAEKLSTCFPGKKTVVVQQDEYIHSAFQMPWIENELDWEDPESLDFNRMYYEIGWLRSNVDVLIVEGLFAFYYPELNRTYDKRILVEVDFDHFLERKQKDERWGKVPDWYIKHIWDSYMKFGQPSNKENLLQIDGNSKYDLDAILKFLDIN